MCQMGAAHSRSVSFTKIKFSILFVAKFQPISSRYFQCIAVNWRSSFTYLISKYREKRPGTDTYGI